jgi:lipopolysaccharide transport system ATP-binding protein
MAAMNSLCQRAVQLSGGELVMQGEVGQVIEHYSSTLAEETDLVFPANRAQAGITAIHIDREALKRRDLDLRIAFGSPVPIATPIGGIVLRALGGEPLWGSNGRFHPSLDQASGLTGGVVRCEARDIPLVPGKYILSVWLGDYYTDFDEKIDLTVINLGRADPGSLDHLRPPPAVQGYVDWEARWSVLPV